MSYVKHPTYAHQELSYEYPWLSHARTLIRSHGTSTHGSLMLVVGTQQHTAASRRHLEHTRNMPKILAGSVLLKQKDRKPSHHPTRHQTAEDPTQRIPGPTATVGSCSTPAAPRDSCDVARQDFMHHTIKPTKPHQTS